MDRHLRRLYTKLGTDKLSFWWQLDSCGIILPIDVIVFGRSADEHLHAIGEVIHLGIEQEVIHKSCSHAAAHGPDPVHLLRKAWAWHQSWGKNVEPEWSQTSKLGLLSWGNHEHGVKSCTLCTCVTFPVTLIHMVWIQAYPVVGKISQNDSRTKGPCRVDATPCEAYLQEFKKRGTRSVSVSWPECRHTTCTYVRSLNFLYSQRVNSLSLYLIMSFLRCYCYYFCYA